MKRSIYTSPYPSQIHYFFLISTFQFHGCSASMKRHHRCDFGEVTWSRYPVGSFVPTAAVSGTSRFASVFLPCFSCFWLDVVTDGDIQQQKDCKQHGARKDVWSKSLDIYSARDVSTNALYRSSLCFENSSCQLTKKGTWFVVVLTLPEALCARDPGLRQQSWWQCGLFFVGELK